MIYRALIAIATSSVCSFCLGLFVWLMQVPVAKFLLLCGFRENSILFNYDYFIMLIIHIVIPIGAFLGLLGTEKYIFKDIKLSILGAFISLMSSIIGLTIVIWLPVLLGVDIARSFPLFSYLGYDILYTIILPIFAGILSSAGYYLTKILIVTRSSMKNELGESGDTIPNSR